MSLKEIGSTAVALLDGVGGRLAGKVQRRSWTMGSPAEELGDLAGVELGAAGLPATQGSGMTSPAAQVSE